MASWALRRKMKCISFPYIILYKSHLKIIQKSLFTDLKTSVTRKCRCLWWIFTSLLIEKSSSQVVICVMKKNFFVLRLTISLQTFKLMAHDKTECLKKNLSVLEHFLMRCNECNLYFAFQQIFSIFSKSLAYHQ